MAAALVAALALGNRPPPQVEPLRRVPWWAAQQLASISAVRLTGVAVLLAGVALIQLA